MARDKTTDAGILAAHNTERAVNQMRADFGNRLGRALDKKMWLQSDLMRASGVGKDSISKYIAGETTPSRRSLERLASALGISPNDLWPNYAGEIATPTVQKWELDPSNEDFAFVTINARVRYSTAMALMDVLKAERSDAANAR